MSVFTTLVRSDIEQLTQTYNLGILRDFKGIEGGSENTNYFITLDKKIYVLTLVERNSFNSLQYMIKILDYLNIHGIPVPYAIPNIKNRQIGKIADKHALIQPKLSGAHILKPSQIQCKNVGRVLAKIHSITMNENTIIHPSDRNLSWVFKNKHLQDNLNKQSASYFQAALTITQEICESYDLLPQSNIHADLFKDNVLFTDNEITGVIDFYNSCSGPMLYDLAIAINDWCSQNDGSLNQLNYNTLLSAYNEIRPLTKLEENLISKYLVVGCLRFWISRLIASQLHQKTNSILIHNPKVFEKRLYSRLNEK